MKKIILAVMWVVLAMVLVGCDSVRGKGGMTKTTLPGVETSAVQPENPKEGTTQDVNAETEESYTVPAGSVIEEEAPVIQEQPASRTPEKSGRGLAGVQEASRVTKRTSVSEPMVVVKRTKHTAVTKVGAAQKDDIGAQIAAVRSFRWLQILGAVVFLGGVATAVWPPAKVVVGGSLTTSAAIAGAGLFLIFFPPFFVGHEVLIFAVCAGGAGIWFFAHRHGGMRGELQALKSVVGK